MTAQGYMQNTAPDSARRRLSVAGYITVVLATVLLLALPAVASAHFLSSARAMDRADTEAYAFATTGEWYGTHSCHYRTNHSRRCLIYSYDEYEDITCDAFVNVRFASGRSYRVVAGRWWAIDCYGGNEYGA